LTVLFSHLGFQWSPAGYGVTAFFVLSGFLITHLLIKENRRTGEISLRAFYTRRSLRVFPAFYAFALIYVGGRLLLGKGIEWPQVVTSLTYTRDYYQAILHPFNNSMGHTWSLAVEEQFYLLWPFIFLHFRTRQRVLTKILVWTILSVWAYRALLTWIGVHPDYIYYAFDTRMDALAIGCLTALAIHNGIDLSFRSWLIGPLLFAGICILQVADSLRIWRFDFHAVVVDALLPVLFTLLIIHAIQFADHPVYYCLNNPVARYMGIISYPLYLYHPIVGNVFHYSHSWAKVAGEVAVCVGLASGSYFIVEKPFLKLKKYALIPLPVLGKAAAAASGA
jgi:peptidoglycan/LPS O-acetylase OafA/YrhL